MAKSAVKELLKVARIRTMHGDLAFAKKNSRKARGVSASQPLAQMPTPTPRHIQIKPPAPQKMQPEAAVPIPRPLPDIPKPISSEPKPKLEIAKPAPRLLPRPPKPLPVRQPAPSISLSEKGLTVIPAQEIESDATLAASSIKSRPAARISVVTPARKPVPISQKILALPPAEENSRPIALLPADDKSEPAAPPPIKAKPQPAALPSAPKVPSSKPIAAPPPVVPKDQRTTFLEDVERWTKAAENHP